MRTLVQLAVGGALFSLPNFAWNAGLLQWRFWGQATLHLLDGEVILQSIPRFGTHLTPFALLAAGILSELLLPLDG